jgi:hypothetical protein
VKAAGDRISFNYTTVLNIVFLIIAGVLFVRFLEPMDRNVGAHELKSIIATL